MKKFSLFASVVLLLAGFLLSVAVKDAMAFPERPIDLIVFAGVGGGADATARALADGVRSISKVPLVVTNMPGGGGTRSMLHVAGLPADGHTVLVVSTSHLIDAVKPRTRAHIMKDFDFLLRLNLDTTVISVAANSRFKTLVDMIEFGKKNPRFLTVGGTTPGGWAEIGAVGFFRAAGVEITFVPFESGAEIQAAILGGHIHIAWEEVAESIALIQAGRMRGLATVKEKRHPALPDVPSTVELGIPFTHGLMRALVVKKGTPPERAKFLHDLFRRAMDSEPFRKFVDRAHLDARPGYLGPAETTKFAEGQIVLFTEVLRTLGHIK